MFIKKTRVRSRNQTYTYLQLVESIRRDGRSTHRVIANLGREDQIKPEQVDRLIAVLSPYGEGEVVQADSLRLTGAREYGSLLALDALWRELECESILKALARERRFRLDPGAAIKAMVYARLLAPGSEMGVVRWAEGVHAPELEGIEVHHLYRALDFLVEVKESLESGLVQVLTERLVSDLNLVLFDTTSIYFEGEGPDGLAEHGYSRDRRGDRPQVVLGLLTTREGFPLSHVVLPGNTGDLTALKHAITAVSKNLPIGKVILVIDRGMVSESNLGEMERLGLEYIAGAKFRHLATRAALGRAGRYRKVADNLLVKEVGGGPRRSIVCYNPEEANRDRQQRASIVAYLEEELQGHGLKGLLKNQAARRYLKVEGERVALDRERVRQDARHDGKWVLVTNSPLPAEEVALAYKGLWRVERAFRTLKTPLEIRPIYHWMDRRVRGHVTVCVLAYLMEKTLEHKLERAGIEMSAAQALAHLSRLMAVGVQVGKRRVIRQTEPTPLQRQILQACGARLAADLQVV